MFLLGHRIARGEDYYRQGEIAVYFNEINLYIWNYWSQQFKDGKMGRWSWISKQEADLEDHTWFTKTFSNIWGILFEGVLEVFSHLHKSFPALHWNSSFNFYLWNCIISIRLTPTEKKNYTSFCIILMVLLSFQNEPEGI